MIDVIVGIIEFVFGFVAGGFVIGFLVMRGMRQQVHLASSGDQRSNPIIQFKAALNSGMLDAEILGAVRRNELRPGR